MNCPYCSQIVPDDIQFCPRCGTQMGSPLPGSPAYRAPVPPGFQPPTSGKAIGSLISGIFSLFFPAAVVAVILGHLSLSEISKSAGRLKGRGLAVAGLVLGYLGIAIIPFVLIIAAIAIPNLLRARMAANEASAVGALHSYSYALGTYSSQCSQIGFPASLSQLGHGGKANDCDHAGVLDGVLSREFPIRSGYTFRYTVGPRDNLGRTISFTISAEPVKAGNTGVRYFFVDETGVVRASSSGPADAESPAL